MRVSEKVFEFLEKNGEVFVMKGVSSRIWDNPSETWVRVGKSKSGRTWKEKDGGSVVLVERNQFETFCNRNGGRLRYEYMQREGQVRFVRVMDSEKKEKGFHKEYHVVISESERFPTLNLREVYLNMAYTDGACHIFSQPKNGGWGMVYLRKLAEEWTDKALRISSYGESDIILTDSGGDTDTTNNRMEMKAILSAVKHTEDYGYLQIYTDSKYCIQMFGNALDIREWRIDEYKNPDLIREYRNLIKTKHLRVMYRWVKGHSGDYFNEMADQLAVKACEEVDKKYPLTKPDMKNWNNPKFEKRCVLPIPARQIYVVYVSGCSDNYSIMIARPRGMQRQPTGRIFYTIYRNDFVLVENRKRSDEMQFEELYFAMEKIGNNADIVFRSDSEEAVKFIQVSRGEEELSEEMAFFKNTASAEGIRYRAEVVNPKYDSYIRQAIQMTKKEFKSVPC